MLSTETSRGQIFWSKKMERASLLTLVALNWHLIGRAGLFVARRTGWRQKWLSRLVTVGLPTFGVSAVQFLRCLLAVRHGQTRNICKYYWQSLRQERRQHIHNIPQRSWKIFWINASNWYPNKEQTSTSCCDIPLLHENSEVKKKTLAQNQSLNFHLRKISLLRLPHKNC